MARHVVRECSRWVIGAASNCIMGLFWGPNFHAVFLCNVAIVNGEVSKDVFERRTSTGSAPFPFMGSGLA